VAKDNISAKNNIEFLAAHNFVNSITLPKDVALLASQLSLFGDRKTFICSKKVSQQSGKLWISNHTSIRALAKH
jgi:hypothetical protein